MTVLPRASTNKVFGDFSSAGLVKNRWARIATQSLFSTLVAAFACGVPIEQRLKATPSAARDETVQPDEIASTRAHLRGRAFPREIEYEPRIPSPIKVRRVSSATELIENLCRLEPGERLVLASGIYSGRFEATVEKGCSDGTASRPIQVFGEPGAVVRGAFHAGNTHWQFVGLEISPSALATLPAMRIDGAHILLDRMHLHDGRKDGVILADSAKHVVISNSHIHDFHREDASGQRIDAHGIVIWPGAADVTLVANHIHDNSGDSIQIYGPGDGSISEARYARDIVIRGNLLHNDVENGVDVKDARNILIESNRIWGYGPADQSTGAAIVVHYDARDVVIRHNHVVDARGILVERGKLGRDLGSMPASGKPKNILIVSNYLENAEPAGVGFTVHGADCVQFYHNVVRNYRGGLTARVGAADTSRLRVANNVFLDLAMLAFWVSSDYRQVFDLFDFNAFGTANGSVPVQIGGRELQSSGNVFLLEDHVGEGRRMPYTVVTRAITIDGNDLARISGLDVANQGIDVVRDTTCSDVPDISRRGGGAPLGIAEASR